MIKKHGNLIVLAITFILYALHVCDVILNNYDIYIVIGRFYYYSTLLFLLLILSTNIVSIVYVVKERSMRNIVILFLSLLSSTGLFVLIYKAAILSSHF